MERIGIERLDEYGLWLQIVDETGREIFTHNKPAHYPESYSMAELLTLAESRYENEHTIFVGDVTLSDRTLNYVVGFPYAIGKAMLYYNGESVARLSPFTKMWYSFPLVPLSLLPLFMHFGCPISCQP